jgi:transcriptional regulator with XRE-family HTH domain
MSRGNVTALRSAAQFALIDLRKELGMSQQDMAVALATSVRSLARWETASFPHSRLIKRLEKFATRRGLKMHAAQFRRLLRQEQFLKANRKFFMSAEGLDVQLAIAIVCQSREDPEVADHWSVALEGLSGAISRALDFPKTDDTGIWDQDDLFDLWERLRGYAKQAQKDAKGL